MEAVAVQKKATLLLDCFEAEIVAALKIKFDSVAASSVVDSGINPDFAEARWSEFSFAKGLKVKRNGSTKKVSWINYSKIALALTEVCFIPHLPKLPKLLVEAAFLQIADFMEVRILKVHAILA